MPAIEIVFWTCAALIVWTQVGYALAIALLARIATSRRRPGRAGAHPFPDREGLRVAEGRSAREDLPAGHGLPAVSLIVAAHDEQWVIERKLANVLALRYPRELLQVVVACDGCTDETAQCARAAGADLVLELPRGGKIRAQDAAVARSSGEVVAFSDANALWEPDALERLVVAFEDPRVGYACGQVTFVQGADGSEATNQEGVYWRYEMAMREAESRLGSITAGNGAIYATRREAYIVVDPIMGHDLSFPFNMVKRGWRAVYVPDARAVEKMVPSIEGELRRKRRMMSHTWPIVLRGGMLSPRGYTLGYALMMLSHRVLRYSTPLLHALALAANAALVVAGSSPLYTVTLALQLALLAAAAVGSFASAPREHAGGWLAFVRSVVMRGLLIARYYVLTTLSPALGLWDWLRHGTDAYWDVAEGTR